MSRARPPENFEIAALRKKQAEVFDPLAPGSGTPWEDRGTHGVIGAFIKTCTMSMTSPAKLFTSIRRPETTSDVAFFVWGCAALWGASVLIHGLLLIPYYNHQPHTEVDTWPYMEILLITAAVAVVGTWSGLRFYSTINYKMVSQEKQLGAITLPLVQNVNSYALGPSLLAVIPVVGPLLAILWIGINFMVAGAKRLRIRAAGAIIDAVLPYLAVLVTAVVLAVVGHYLLPYLIGDPTIDTLPHKESSFLGN